MKRLVVLGLLAPAAVVAAACSSDVGTKAQDDGGDASIDASAGGDAGAGDGSSAGGSGGSGGTAGSGGAGGSGAGGAGGGSGAMVPQSVPCETTFRYVPPAGRIVKEAAVTGEWNNFVKPGAPLVGPDQDGAFTGTVKLPAGKVAYKLLLNGNYELDPEAHYQKYVGGEVNSAVRVADCKVPQLAVVTSKVVRPSARVGEGSMHVDFDYVDGADLKGFDPATLHAVVTSDFQDTAVTPSVVAKDRAFAIDLAHLKDGKYTVTITAADKSGAATEPLVLPFWIEKEAFDWHDAVIYMAMTDRFKNGDKSNDPKPTPGVDPRADFQGGDFQGLTQAIAHGDLDAIGVRAIWITPMQTNPSGPYVASDQSHQTMGYHGYWPVKGREVEPRIGGEAGLKALVKEAHAHGIRILQDFVVNHVHQEHEYFKAHPDWFRTKDTSCVCGTAGCDWTDKRLTCLFAPYMPDVDWTVPAVSEQYESDALYWLEHFDIDGLRMDAVKHVETAAVANLAGRVKDTLEKAGTHYFLMGETAMGWSDCGLGCNQFQYDTISQYIGPHLLDGQFDFVLYAAVPGNSFFNDSKGLLHADYWAQASGWEYPKGSIMTPYIGSHDTPRSVTLASHDGRVFNQWSDPAAAPTSSDAYERQRLALGWLLGLPGAPLVYYGDEYGQWGGSDPNNRTMWHGDSALKGDEAATFDLVKKLGTARKDLVALRRGDYVKVDGTDSWLVYARVTAKKEVVLVAMTKSPKGETIDAQLPPSLGLPDGTALTDRLGGSVAPVVSGGRVKFSLPPRGVAYLAP